MSASKARESQRKNKCFFFFFFFVLFCFVLFFGRARNNATLVVASVLCNVKIVKENIETDA